MKIVEIIRQETSEEDGTFGTVKIDKKVFCVSLEPPYRQNKSSVSSIPAGQYLAYRRQSPKHGDTFTVQNVTDRSFINFHPGMLDEHTEGCILLGESVVKLRGDRALQNSGHTFDRFMDEFDQDVVFHLTIREDY